MDSVFLLFENKMKLRSTRFGADKYQTPSNEYGSAVKK